MRNITFEKRDWLYLLAIVMLAGGLKLWLTVSGVVPFNADEAVVALMARHILQGELPIFFYGQAYMGSLDAWIAAAGFALTGEYVCVIRIIQGLLYLGVVITTVFLGIALFKDKRIGLLAGLLLAIPTVNVSLYTTASLGGYGEALLLGNLILLVGIQLDHSLAQKSEIKRWQWLLYGFLGGFGFWAFGLSLVYSLPVSAVLIWRLFSNRHSIRWRSPALIVLVGVLIGATPWWIYAFQYGFSSLATELLGGAIAGVERLSWLGQVWQHLVSLILLGSTVIFGFRPPWGVQWLGLPLLPFVLGFYVATIGFSTMKLLEKPLSLRRSRKVIEGDCHASLAVTIQSNEEEDFRKRLFMHGIVWCLFFGFLFTPYGADPSGRYFLPVSVPLALLAAELIVELRRRSKIIPYILVALLLVYNLWGTLQSALHYPPGITTQFAAITQIDTRYYDELIAFLQANDEPYGYTNYWVSYPLAFLSGEEILYIPRLPYHQDFRYTPRDDRYLPYQQKVQEAKKVAFITTHHPELDNYLRAQFVAQNLTWDEETIGDFHIFFNLSAKIHVEQIGLGELQH